jgi:hypothetical protein
MVRGDTNHGWENYIHSSAGFYYKGVQGIYPVNNIMHLMEIDLSGGR